MWPLRQNRVARCAFQRRWKQYISARSLYGPMDERAYGRTMQGGQETNGWTWQGYVCECLLAKEKTVCSWFSVKFCISLTFSFTCSCINSKTMRPRYRIYGMQTCARRRSNFSSKLHVLNVYFQSSTFGILRFLASKCLHQWPDYNLCVRMYTDKGSQDVELQPNHQHPWLSIWRSTIWNLTFCSSSKTQNHSCWHTLACWKVVTGKQNPHSQCPWTSNSKSNLKFSQHLPYLTS